MRPGPARDQTSTAPSANGTLLDLKVGPVAHGGWCVARHAGKVVFVRHALPGERVRAKVVNDVTRFTRAEAVEVLRASPDRVEPPCPYAGPGRCGGCDWQHASLEAQRRLKAAVVEEQLRRVAGIVWPVTVEELPPVPGAGPGLGWRTRVRFAVRADGVVGLRRHRSHEVESVDRCPLAHPELARLGIERQRWPGATEVEAAVSATTADRVVAVSSRPAKRSSAVPRLDAPVRVVRGTPVPGPHLPYVRERAAGRLWRVSATSFWQVHPAAAQTLADAVVAGLEPHQGERVLDLYAGVGLFAGVLAGHVGPTGQVTAIEESPLAVRDARDNLRDLPNVTVVPGRVERVLGPGLDRELAADVVVLDPPRSGAGQAVVRRIAALAARRIAYVSCDPATLARDQRTFGELGWTLTSLRAFDAFPMTHHVEAVAILERRTH